MNSMVGIDLREASGMPLRDVRGAGCISYNDGGLGFERILLVFDSLGIALRADDDTDEIIIEALSDDHTNMSKTINCFEKFIGKDFSWSWDACNSQGYHDALLIAFENPVPKFLILSSASVLTLYKVEPVTKSDGKICI